MKFKPVQKANPQNRTEKKWYAQIVIEGESTIDELVSDIEKFSALSEADIRGVILALENVAQTKLAEGRIVRFDKIGSLYPSLSSHPSETEDKVDASKIKSVKVNFRPGKRILQALQNADKKKVKQTAKTS